MLRGGGGAGGGCCPLRAGGGGGALLGALSCSFAFSMPPCFCTKS